MKTNKSYTKRLKITKNGKILSRKKGQNHNNSKESGRSKIAKGRMFEFKISTREKRRFLPGLGKTKAVVISKENNLK